MHFPRHGVVWGLIAVWIACGLAIGCGGSSSGGGSKKQAASNTNTGGGSGASGSVGIPTGPKSPAFSLQNVTPASPARQATAMQLLNDELQALWDQVRPDAIVRIQNEADALVQAGNTVNYSNGPISVGIVGLRNLRLDAPIAPGFDELTYNRVYLSLPRQGSWMLSVDVDLGLNLSLGPLSPTLALPVTLDIELWARAEAHLDDTDPTRPRIVSANQPQVQFTVTVSTTDPTVQQYLPYVNQVVQPLVQLALQGALGALVVPGLMTYPGDVWADGAPPISDSGTFVPWEEVAANIDRKLLDYHAPHGTVHRIVMDQPVDDESWLDAYSPGGPGITGQVVDVQGMSDSAIHTGYFLAAQACRWAILQDQESYDNLRALMDGVNRLYAINGNSGLLARSTGSIGSVVGQRIQRRGAFTQRQMEGDTWLGWQSDKGVSRDQYTGIMFGMAVVHEVSGDAAMRAECEARLQESLDYFIRNDWVMDDDRPDWTQAGNGGTPLIVRVQGMYQQINYLVLAEALLPGQYSAELQRLEDLAPATWISTWFSTTQLDGYYQFNLQMLNAYNYFRYETSQQRFMEMARAYRIVQRWVGHHRNPHFDVIQAGVDPSLEATLHPQVREQLRQFLTRNHRERTPPGLDLSVIQWAPFTFPDPLDANGRVELLPTEPIPVPLQKYTGYFLWQKQPVRPAERLPTNHGAFLESTGLDYVVPYWMGRWHGAF